MLRFEVFLVPAIGGFVTVGQMLMEYGDCHRHGDWCCFFESIHVSYPTHYRAWRSLDSSITQQSASTFLTSENNVNTTLPEPIVQRSQSIFINTVHLRVQLLKQLIRNQPPYTQMKWNLSIPISYTDSKITPHWFSTTQEQEKVYLLVWIWFKSSGQSHLMKYFLFWFCLHVFYRYPKSPQSPSCRPYTDKENMEWHGMAWSTT